MPRARLLAPLLLALGLAAALPGATAPDVREVTLLFTNDFESAFDPIPAWWRTDVRHVGGIAQLATLVERERRAAPLSFLFDAGDIFTGTLTKRTRGELPFELMTTMGYDAMCVGNHEFEYGWEVFREACWRAAFPVLAANIFYAGTDIPFVQPWAVLERDGFRVGVVGVIGLDAATALIPAHVRGLEFRDPVAAVRGAVEKLRPDVDLVVVLAHQGWTAPMQTDAEGRPEVQRDVVADVRLASEVAGIDVLLGGHADAGTERPVVSPTTGTLVMQTYGHGTRLGRLRLRVRREAPRVELVSGELLLVDSDRLPPEPRIAAKLARYRTQHAELDEIVTHAPRRVVRDYVRESDLGNLTADVLRAQTGAPVALMPSGALRGDLPAGPVPRGKVLDVFPFQDKVEVLELPGSVLREAIEHGLTLERGLLQVSGVEVTYDAARPPGQRVLSIEVGGQPLDPGATYAVATLTLLAQGGDTYRMLAGHPRLPGGGREYAAVLEEWASAHDPIEPSARGRYRPAAGKGAHAAPASRPPNVVLILADDLGYGDLASYGHLTIRTPALDRLAREGLRFTSFYAGSPLCSPSRASLLTGRIAFRTGIESWIPPDTNVQLGPRELTLATLLKRRGYETFMAGKWHLNGGLDVARHTQPQDHGFDHWLALHAWAIPNHRDPTNFFRDGRPVGPMKGFAAQIVTDEALAWLQRRDPGAPFFLYVPYVEVHGTIASPDRWNALYAALTRSKPDPFPNEGRPPDNLEARGPGEYYANVSHLDFQIARLLEGLDRLGLRNDTLVVFTSDNGPVTTEWRQWWEVNLYGSTGGFRGRKGDLYEGGLRVPAIVRWPGRVAAGGVTDVPTSVYDVLPTVAAAVGFATPDDRPIDGEDLSSLLRGERFERARPLYWEFDDPHGFHFALRDGRLKLLADRALGKVCLYDLAADRFEIVDRAAERPDVVAHLLEELRAIRASVESDPLRPRPQR